MLTDLPRIEGVVCACRIQEQKEFVLVATLRVLPESAKKISANVFVCAFVRGKDDDPRFSDAWCQDTQKQVLFVGSRTERRSVHGQWILSDRYWTSLHPHTLIC